MPQIPETFETLQFVPYYWNKIKSLILEKLNDYVLKPTTDTTIANGDKLVITDASNSNKIERTSIVFDGSTTTKALTQKGTWETFLQSAPVTSVNGQTGAVNLTIPSAVTESTVSGWGFTKNAVAKAGDTMTGALTVNAAAANTVNIIGGDNSSGNQIALNVGSGTHANMFQVFDDGSAHIVANGTLEVTPSSSQTGLQITSAATTDTALTTNGKVIANQFVKSGGTSGQLLRADGSVMSFPAFSSADNGKVLSVVNGSLAWVMPTAIYSGTSTPDSNTGNNGDLYLQTS